MIKELIKIISDASVTNYFDLAPTNNIIGVEISGILKNISAIIAGALTINGYPDEYIKDQTADEIIQSLVSVVHV